MFIKMANFENHYIVIPLELEEGYEQFQGFYFIHENNLSENDILFLSNLSNKRQHWFSDRSHDVYRMSEEEIKNRDRYISLMKDRGFYRALIPILNCKGVFIIMYYSI